MLESNQFRDALGNVVTLGDMVRVAGAEGAVTSVSLSHAYVTALHADGFYRTTPAPFSAVERVGSNHNDPVTAI